MKNIKVTDNTLCNKDKAFAFKEKLEIVRQLDKLNVDVIEFPELSDEKTDALLIRTVSSFVKNSTLSVAAGSSKASVEKAIDALSLAKKGEVRIEVALSTAVMEYVFHKKAQKMQEWVAEAVATAKAKVNNVAFCASDATRAEYDFLVSAIKTAVQAGATRVMITDDAGEMLPDEFAAFAAKVAADAGCPIMVGCSDKNGFALSSAVLALKAGIAGVRAAVCGTGVPMEGFAAAVQNCGGKLAVKCGLSFTELHRIIKQINRIASDDAVKNATSFVSVDEQSVSLDATDSRKTVITAAAKLGYDLSEEDQAKVYEEFCRVAPKKAVGAKELDAIIASVALQVPATYKLESYVVNNGNIIASSAQVTLSKAGVQVQGVSIGNGPVDAAFLAIEQIVGRHYELDDFQIQSVTEGKEAMGAAIVKLRNNGKLYSGSGISTDIIGASIRAYISALNKIAYEEDGV